MELKLIKIRKSDEINVILGQSHFIKTVEDLYEVLVSGVPGIKFGLAFIESSGACKIRCEGNDPQLIKMASENASEISAGHVFIIFIKDAYPINVLNAIKNTPEVCNIYCATANPVEVIIAENKEGARGVLGVIDGLKTKGIENEGDISWRKGLLRKIGYKL